MTIGTTAYLAPEQVTGGDIGPPVDTYALGLVLLESLAGRSGAYLAELVLSGSSAWIDQEVKPRTLMRDFDLELVELRRDGKRVDLPAEKEEPLRYGAGDHVRVVGPVSTGSDAPGGLSEIFGDGSNQAGQSFSEDADKIDERLATDPRNEALLKELVRRRVVLGAEAQRAFPEEAGTTDLPDLEPTGT